MSAAYSSRVGAICWESTQMCEKQMKKTRQKRGKKKTQKKDAKKDAKKRRKKRHKKNPMYSGFDLGWKELHDIRVLKTAPRVSKQNNQVTIQP